MASHPSGPPPSYEEVVGSSSYVPFQTNYNIPADVPPPYVYDNSSYQPTEYLPGSTATSDPGPSENCDVFVIRPPLQSNQIDPIPPKPSTPTPSAPPAPPPVNNTATSNETPAAPQRQSQTPPQDPPQNTTRNRAPPKPSLADKEVRYQFFRDMYKVLCFQALCAMSIGGGIYSNEDVRSGVESVGAFTESAVGTLVAAIFLTWLLTELRKNKRPFCIIFMIVFTLLIAYWVMVLACKTLSISVLISAGIISITCIITIILTLQKRFTFNLISGMICTLVAVVVLSGISFAIFKQGLPSLFAGVGALLFLWWVMIITWCMVDDHKKNKLHQDQYLAVQPFIYAGVLPFFPMILLGIIFCKFEWKKYK